MAGISGTKFPVNSDDNLSLNAVTTGNGKVFVMNDCRQTSWDLAVSTTAGAGVVVIETNSESDSYTGTWYELDSIILTSLPVGPAAYHGTYPGPLPFVRARVATDVTNATVKARINGLVG